MKESVGAHPAPEHERGPRTEIAPDPRQSGEAERMSPDADDSP